MGATNSLIRLIVKIFIYEKKKENKINFLFSDIWASSSIFLAFEMIPCFGLLMFRELSNLTQISVFGTLMLVYASNSPYIHTTFVFH